VRKRTMPREENSSDVVAATCRQSWP
jgi:hypothetical protein